MVITFTEVNLGEFMLINTCFVRICTFDRDNICFFLLFPNNICEILNKFIFPKNIS